MSTPVTNILIEAVDGKDIGLRFPLRDGLVVGRTEGDLNIQDPKISSKHARLEARGKEWWLVDLGSSNGIKVAGQKQLQLHLEPGVVFTLGRTMFKVSLAEESFVLSGGDLEDTAPGESETLPAASAPHEIQTASLATDPNQPNWKDHVLALVMEGLKGAVSQSREVAPFVPPINLEFTRGSQTGTEWYLGYGPREIGAGSIDLTLEDPGLPTLCFRLIPHQNGAFIKVYDRAKGQLTINGKAVETTAIEDGDVIEIGTTQIRVSFEEDPAR